LIHLTDNKYFIGRGLSLAPGVQVPEVIQKALETTPSTTFRRSASNRESMQRKRYWWLPYVVLEFDKNEILIDAMGGDLSSPVWNYRADLYVFSQYFYCKVVHYIHFDRFK
jgi:serum/glucocorticoid-regulated kinase 2